MRRGDLPQRLDVGFIKNGGYQELTDLQTLTLGELVSQEPDYGSGSRSIPVNQSDDIKYIRITDFGDDGIPEGHEFVTADKVENKYLLQDADILFARSGATAGKTFIYTSDIGEAIFAGYCIRFKIDSSRALPSFVYYYTKTGRYLAWVRSIQRPSAQPNINKEEFKAFTIPLPPLETQQELVARMQAARERRAQLLREADAKLAGMDAFLLDRLGLS